MVPLSRNISWKVSLLLLCCVLSLCVSGCGKGGGNSAILDGGSGGGGGGDGDDGDFGTLKWSIPIQNTAFGGTSGHITPTFISSPAIAPDGTIYAGSVDHFLYALNPDGTVKWKYQTGGNLYASPAIGSDGTIYFGSADMQIYAINPDGTLKWIKPTGCDFTSSAAIGADGTIYIAGTNQLLTLFNCQSSSSCASTTSQACGSGLPSCPSDQICVPVQTGSLCAIPQNIACGQNLPACPAGDACVAGQSAQFTETAQQSILFAITDNGTAGKIKWQSVLAGPVNSSPAISSDGKTLYIGSEGDFVVDRTDICDLKSPYILSDVSSSVPANGHLYAFNTADGSIKWDFKATGPVESSPAIASDGTVYVGSKVTRKICGNSNCSTLIDATTSLATIFAITDNGSMGRLKCSKYLFGGVDSSPAVGVDGTIYVGSDDFHVWALPPVCPAPNDWEEKWVKPTRDVVKSSPAIASDGTIYIGSNDGSIYAFNPDGSLKVRFIEGSTTVNSGPSIGPDGTIYFSSADNKLNALFGTTGIGLAGSSWPKFRHDLLNTGRKQ